jgi:hypothetical protein
VNLVKRGGSRSKVVEARWVGKGFLPEQVPKEQENSLWTTASLRGSSFIHCRDSYLPW